MKDKTIIRCAKNDEAPYFAISRALAQDTKLSWEARGVMFYLLSKPDDWVVQVNDLKQQCGRDKVYKILDELVASKYMTRSEKMHKPDGTYEPITYKVYERPLPEMPEVVTPLPEKPYTDLPDTVKPTLQNTELTDNRVTGESAHPTPPILTIAEKTQCADKLIRAWADAYAYMGTFNTSYRRRDAIKLVDMGATYDEIRAMVSERIKNRTKPYLFKYVVEDYSEWKHIQGKRDIQAERDKQEQEASEAYRRWYATDVLGRPA